MRSCQYRAIVSTALPVGDPSWSKNMFSGFLSWRMNRTDERSGCRLWHGGCRHGRQVPRSERSGAPLEELSRRYESVTLFSDEELLAAGESLAAQRDPGFVTVRLVRFSKMSTSLTRASSAGARAMRPRPIPQHRPFLETFWGAFENAGYDPAGMPWPGGGVRELRVVLVNMVDLGLRRSCRLARACLGPRRASRRRGRCRETARARPGTLDMQPAVRHGMGCTDRVGQDLWPRRDVARICTARSRRVRRRRTLVSGRLAQASWSCGNPPRLGRASRPETRGHSAAGQPIECK